MLHIRYMIYREIYQESQKVIVPYPLLGIDDIFKVHMQADDVCICFLYDTVRCTLAARCALKEEA